MGKNSSIRSLGKCIGNIVLHKLLLRHTNRPESKKHLRDEIEDYGADAKEKSQEYSWTDEEKAEIEDKAYRRVKNILEKYSDLDYEESEINSFIQETMEKLF